MCSLAVVVAFYVYRLHKRKREVERKLAEIEEANRLRPEPVANAMRMVETDFFNSDYFLSVCKKIESGANFKPADWEEMELKLKIVYPNFANSLFALHNMSTIEWRVCMLLKLRIKPADIAMVMKKEKSSISSVRARLYKKIFNKTGSAKEWDEFIFSL